MRFDHRTFSLVNLVETFCMNVNGHLGYKHYFFCDICACDPKHMVLYHVSWSLVLSLSLCHVCCSGTLFISQFVSCVLQWDTVYLSVCVMCVAVGHCLSLHSSEDEEHVSYVSFSDFLFRQFLVSMSFSFINMA